MSDAVTLKDGIVIYKDGFPPDFKETIMAKLRRYWVVVNRSTLESRKLGEQLQEMHQETYDEFVKGPLYKFPERSDAQARAEYFRRCDDICDKSNKTPRDHIMTTHAGMAAISVLQTQDVGEYTLQYGGLSARDIIVRSRVVAYVPTSRPTDGDHSRSRSREEMPGRAGPHSSKALHQTSPDNPRTPPGDDAQPSELDSASLFTPRQNDRQPALLPEPEFASPSFGCGGPEEYESILPNFSDAVAISTTPPPALPRPQAADVAPPEVRPKYLALIGKNYRSKVFDLEDMRFVVADFAVSVVRGTKLYVLRYVNGERYVNEDGLERILEMSALIEE